MDASLELGKKLGHHCVWPPGYRYFFQAHFLPFLWFSFWLQFAAWQPQQQEQLAVEISLNPLAIYSALRKAHHTCGSLFKFVLPARLGAP